MADPALICEVSANGGVYSNWLTVQVSQDFRTDGWVRHFRLVCAEPSSTASLMLAPGDQVDITLAGQTVIQQGYIRDRQAAYDGNRHAVEVSGYSKAGLITAASIDGGTGQYRGYKVDAIANAVLQNYGISFSVQNGPSGWDTPFPNVIVRNGESPFSLISRLCKQRGLFFYADASGNIQAGPNSNSGMVSFVEGQNILAANCHLTMPEVDKLVFNSQLTGSDSAYGKKVSEIQAQSSISGGQPGTLKQMAEMPLDQQGVQLRTGWEAARLQAMTMEVSITYQGWLKPGVGGLWDPSDGASVQSPMLFPTSSGGETLKVAGFTYQQDANGGTTTTVILVNQLAWNQQFPNGQTADPVFNQTITQPQVESAT